MTADHAGTAVHVLPTLGHPWAYGTAALELSLQASSEHHTCTNMGCSNILHGLQGPPVTNRFDVNFKDAFVTEKLIRGPCHG